MVDAVGCFMTRHEYSCFSHGWKTFQVLKTWKDGQVENDVEGFGVGKRRNKKALRTNRRAGKPCLRNNPYCGKLSVA